MNKYQCNKCKIIKIKTDFTTAKGYKDGIKKTCKVCAAERQKRYWENNPAQYEKHKARVKINDKNYKRVFLRHRLTEEAYTLLVNKYNGMCWACKLRKATSIDHDHGCCDKMHSCGKCVRGILCGQCNSALGLLQDDPRVIKNLLAYSLTVKP